MSIYIVMYCDEPSYTPEIEGVFDSYEKAEEYIENELIKRGRNLKNISIEEYDVL